MHKQLEHFLLKSSKGITEEYLEAITRIVDEFFESSSKIDKEQRIQSWIDEIVKYRELEAIILQELVLLKLYGNEETDIK